MESWDDALVLDTIRRHRSSFSSSYFFTSMSIIINQTVAIIPGSAQLPPQWEYLQQNATVVKEKRRKRAAKKDRSMTKS
jgi:hypothetical protein